MIIFKKLRWKNLLSTGNVFTEICLDKNPDTLIVGNNGGGKSTIIDALCFNLFGKPFRKIKKDQLINSINNKNLVTEVEFSINGREYQINRGLKPHILEVIIDGQKLDEAAANKDTQVFIEHSILKLNMKSFSQVVILGSSSFVPFMQLPTGIRREVIEDLLDIQIFSSMSSILKDKIFDIDTQAQTNYNDLATTNELLRNELLRKKESTKKAEEAIEKLRNNIANLEQHIDDIVIVNQCHQVVIDSNMQKISDHTVINEKYSVTQDLTNKLNIKLKRINKELQFFSDNEVCPTCEQDIDEETKTTKLKKYGSDQNEIIDAVTKIDKKADEYRDRLAAVSIIIDTNNEIRAAIILNDLEITAKRNEIKFIRDSINKEVSDSSDVSDALIAEYRGRVDSLNQARSKILYTQQIYSVAGLLLKDTGIKAKIIKQYVPIINQLVNKYLAAMDFFVKFELNETFEERILSRHRDSFTYDSFSEGEKMRIDLALLFTWRAIAKSKNSVSTNLLVLDEVFDASLDGSGCDEFLKLIHALESTNVFVISHKGDILADKFRSLIRFEKHGNYSRIM